MKFAEEVDFSVLTAPITQVGDLDGDGKDDFAFRENWLGNVHQNVYVIYGLYRDLPFRRGEANFSGEADHSDAIFLLTFLFAGGEPPRCEDAADVDDNGSLEITDAIYLLQHLFLGLEPPYPDCGTDSNSPLSCDRPPRDC